MKTDLQTLQIARFALGTSFEEVGEEIIDQLKRHLLDSLGSLFHATGKPVIHKMMRQMQALSTHGACNVPVLAGLPADRAAQLYTALIRYPDFMDNFMGKEATCHPSDNIGSLLSVAQLRPTSGASFLTAMAVAYQIECRLVEQIPVMIEGIDHTLLLAYSITAAASRLLGLDEEQTAHALGMAGCSISPMVTSRASYTYEWKGFASSLDALNCINIIFLAREGMTGPIAIFEGPKGLKEIFNMDLHYDWARETFALIPKCVLKSYNAEVHAQATLEAAIDLKKTHSFLPADIKQVEVTTFLTAYHIIGSGSYGDRKNVDTKEQADHSLFYLTAVALLDGEVYPGQLEPERICRSDVQDLLQKITVRTGFPLHKPLKVAGLLDPYTEAYPEKMKTKVVIHLNDRSRFSQEKEDYYGFNNRPFSWESVIKKFRRLSRGAIDPARQQQIVDMVQQLEQLPDITDFITLICGHEAPKTD